MDASLYTFQPKSPSSSSPSPRRRSRSSPSHIPPRLGAISEDEASVAPDLPPRAFNRPLQRMFHLGFPPGYGSDGDKAPKYNEEIPDYRDVKGPKGENLEDLRHNRHISRRGGWKRLVVMIAVVHALVAVGVGVGLGVGLSMKSRERNRSSEPSPATPPPQNQVFPLGSYTFPTYLSTVTTSCTPNPSTWSCFPYQTYNDSADGSLTSFDWIIKPSSDDYSSPADQAEYLISSSNNPFALSFADTALRLVDAGSDREALTFSVPMQKIVFPDSDISGNGYASLCQYNDTRFSVKLYMAKERTYPSPPDDGANGTKNNSSNTSSNNNNNNDSVGATPAVQDSSPARFRPWPYAVEINQTISSGSWVPDCHRTQDQKPVERIPLTGDVSANAECACRYLNYKT